MDQAKLDDLVQFDVTDVDEHKDDKSFGAGPGKRTESVVELLLERGADPIKTTNSTSRGGVAAESPMMACIGYAKEGNMYATPIRRLMIGASHQFHNRLAESLEMIEEGSKKGSRGFSSVGVATSSLTGSDSCGDGVKPQVISGDIPKEDTRGFIQDTQSDWTFNGRALDARQLPQTDRLMQERAKEVVQERARTRQERAKQARDGTVRVGCDELPDYQRLAGRDWTTVGHIAAASNDLAILWTYGTLGPASDGLPPIYDAFLHGQARAALVLLKRDATAVNAVDQQGRTLAHFAARWHWAAHLARLPGELLGSADVSRAYSWPSGGGGR